MAVPEQTPYIEHTGNGSTTSFALGFQCETKDHLIVLVDEVEPPIATWSLSGGNVVFTTAPAADKKITLQRNTPFNRTAEYQSFNNSFRPQTVNVDFDRIWLKLQELGVADWLVKLYVDRLHQQQEQKINDLKGYVDDRDDELRAYLMEEIRKQGVALDQLDVYYNYLMQRLAQIAVDKGWDASFVVDASGETQQQVNYNGGSRWHSRVGGYQENERVVLANGDIVKSTVDGNPSDPNSDMSGWVVIGNILRVSNISKMLSIVNPQQGSVIKVDSYHAPNFALRMPFSGGGDFIYDSSKSSINDGGLIINGWVRVCDGTTVQVNWFGADPTGETDSTQAILKAQQAITGRVSSAVGSVSKKLSATIEYGAGVYKQGNIPLLSCVNYVGQGKEATQIIPNSTATWIFDTTGTSESGVSGVETRMIYNSISDMTIGYGYVSQFPVMDNMVAGGVNLVATSWCRMSNVGLHRTAGTALKMLDSWDADYNNLTIFNCGRGSSVPALIIDRYPGSNDGTNATTFTRCHFEGNYQHFSISGGARHVYFNWLKLESQQVSSTITNSQGVIFNDLEASVVDKINPMISHIVTTGYSPFVVEYNNPVFIGNGYYLHNDSTAIVRINGGASRNVSKIATGSNLRVRNHYSYDSGPNIFNLTNSRISDCEFLDCKTSNIQDGTDDTIILAGASSRFRGNTISGLGSNSNGRAFLNITASPSILTVDNTFGSGTQWGIRGSLHNNHRDNTASTSLYSTGNVGYKTLSNRGNGIGVGSANSFESIAFSVDATASISNVVQGSSFILIRASNVVNAALFCDVNGSLVLLGKSSVADVVFGGTGLSGDGKVYINKSGANLSMTNRTTSNSTIYMTVISAVG